MPDSSRQNLGRITDKRLWNGPDGLISLGDERASTRLAIVLAARQNRSSA
jgi:hypothetical protein